MDYLNNGNHFFWNPWMSDLPFRPVVVFMLGRVIWPGFSILEKNDTNWQLTIFFLSNWCENLKSNIEMFYKVVCEWLHPAQWGQTLFAVSYELWSKIRKLSNANSQFLWPNYELRIWEGKISIKNVNIPILFARLIYPLDVSTEIEIFSIKNPFQKEWKTKI